MYTDNENTYKDNLGELYLNCLLLDYGGLSPLFSDA
jgi:hypothetical protein